YNRIARFQPGNGYKADIHEFAITPRNTALVLAYRGVRWNGTKMGLGKNTKILDNVIQEIDIKTGAVLFEWHSLGNVGLSASAGKPPADGAPWDYFHANSIQWDGNSYLVSARRPSTIYRIDRQTTRIRWALRGDGRKSSFKMGPGTGFGYQHDALRLPNGDISLFDNGSGRNVPEVNPTSSGLVLRLSSKGKTRTASLVKRFSHPDGIVSGSQGNMDSHEGNFLVGWGSVSQLTEFNAAGDIVLDITFKNSPVSSYRAYKGNWLGIPKRRPAIASEARGAGATVYASWNGASNIAKWKVFSGKNAKSLTEVGSAPWSNLETAIRTDSIGARVQVRAFDDQGKRLGQSKVVPLGRQSE
ncbi:MAG: arylsulfotransferase family protein, partial [Actinomycetota bacterium]|nr:arylsulfotransferase family protein [Actinomycetota bacterium]